MNVPRWLEQAAAFAILWAALALTLGPFIGAWIKHSGRDMRPAPGDPFVPPGEVPAPGYDREAHP